ncbi:SEC-C metal-binding domain-containing protein [Mycolicibacterium sediminis]|uniref:Uncharacterized protein n=1 Tax=Mycolicibacterium sediminis TaxID=1286180 RepID=A0A7I7QPP6_9MYCO|nr:SEC-C metal-binding domain-containing protein [Mycolicibacterium sediminis]BBY28050.1 hypothetical protein MSEDJ_21460 [Mycolicibacterium sediminis]
MSNDAGGAFEQISAQSGRLPVAGLDTVFYRMSANDLFLIKAALTATRDAATVQEMADRIEPVSPPLALWVARQADVRATGDVLSTIVGVLLNLYVVSEEPAPPEELHQVIENAGSGQLHRMPLSRRADCFCGSGKKYKSCHGRTP